MAEELEGLPRLSHALETGVLSWCAARELTRVALAETESAWLEAARGKAQDGRASYQISLHVCATCDAGAQSAAGDQVPVDTAVVEMAQCDAQPLGELLPSATQAPARARRAANENASIGAHPRARAHADDSTPQQSDAGTRCATHEDQTRSTWAPQPTPTPPAPSKPSHRHSGAPSLPAIAIAATCRAAATPPSSTCIISSPAAKAVATKPRIC